jgi:hypothetical protein
MGIELELAELLIIHLLASNFFARFEVETPAIKKIVKWLLIFGITVGLYYWLNHWALIFPIFAVIPGTIYHFHWCKKNGIDPLKATPRKKYYQLRGWTWEE